MDYAIGIDLGGTSVKYALVSGAGEVLFGGKLPSRASVLAEAVMEQVAKAAGTVKEEAAKRNCFLKGIGLGTPGIVDETNRIVLGGAENIAGWENIGLASFLEERTGLPAVVGNDANLMGLGETKYGAAKGCSHVVFLTVGTGIGGAVIIDGKLFNGYANRGTELGHVPLIATGERCACGATGCLEHYASTAALVKRFGTLASREGLAVTGEVNGELIVRLYRRGVPLAVKCMQEHFFYLGRGIAGFINIFSPQRVVIGGGLSESGSFYLENLQRVVEENAIPDCARNTEIVIASLGNRAGCIGAASLVL
ncbi:MAG: ROK family protein [Parabacteroides sp.]|nr:ROK family protein [Parabacteroides sp.]